MDGFRSLEASYGLANTNQRVCLEQGHCLTSDIAPAATYTITAQHQGHVTTTTRNPTNSRPA